MIQKERIHMKLFISCVFLINQYTYFLLLKNSQWIPLIIPNPDTDSQASYMWRQYLYDFPLKLKQKFLKLFAIAKNFCQILQFVGKIMQELIVNRRLRHYQFHKVRS